MARSPIRGYSNRGKNCRKLRKEYYDNAEHRARFYHRTLFLGFDAYQQHKRRVTITHDIVGEYITRTLGKDSIEEIILHRPRFGQLPCPRHGWVITTHARHARLLLGNRPPPNIVRLTGHRYVTVRIHPHVPQL